jgi:hypothetical protein
MKADKINIEQISIEQINIGQINFACRIADVEIHDDTYEVDFDVIAGQAIITEESLNKINKTGKIREFIASVIESKIRNSAGFRERYC